MTSINNELKNDKIKRKIEKMGGLDYFCATDSLS